MSQAFFNIFQNALQSRQQGLELTIASRSCNDSIEITIADNGCGIAAENLSRLFEPFFTTKEVGSGTGMGLTVAREIINEAGGTIEITSTEHCGTMATVRLPLKMEQR
jgi:signal transduction histidine kinase